MILSFKEQFKPKILAGVKDHTIRIDKPNRWKKYMPIHAATGVRTKNYNCFFKSICKSTQSIKINWYRHPEHKVHNSVFRVSIDGESFGAAVFNPGHENNPIITGRLEELARRDGFENVTDFCNWFSEDFTGKIIHWTDKKY